MHCHEWRHHSCGSYDRPYGSYGSPEIIVLDFSPVTNFTTINQIAEALSIGGGTSIAGNVLVIS